MISKFILRATPLILNFATEKKKGSWYNLNWEDRSRTFSENFRRLPKIAEDFWGRPDDVLIVHQVNLKMISSPNCAVSEP